MCTCKQSNVPLGVNPATLHQPSQFLAKWRSDINKHMSSDDLSAGAGSGKEVTMAMEVMGYSSNMESFISICRHTSEVPTVCVCVCVSRRDTHRPIHPPPPHPPTEDLPNSWLPWLQFVCHQSAVSLLGVQRGVCQQSLANSSDMRQD